MDKIDEVNLQNSAIGQHWLVHTGSEATWKSQWEMFLFNVTWLEHILIIIISRSQSTAGLRPPLILSKTPVLVMVG